MNFTLEVEILEFTGKEISVHLKKKSKKRLKACHIDIKNSDGKFKE